VTTYWGKRSEMLYYAAVYQIVAVVGREAQRVLDVGSGNTDYLLRMSWIPEKVQLNKGFSGSGELPGIQRISADFYQWEAVNPYDLVLCLQVLEHVPDPTSFCDRLKQAGQRLVISIPYKWDGKAPGHINDPVDEKKVRSWMGRRPNYSLLVREPFGPARWIAYYDLQGGEEVRITSQFAKEAIAEKTALTSEIKSTNGHASPALVGASPAGPKAVDLPGTAGHEPMPLESASRLGLRIEEGQARPATGEPLPELLPEPARPAVSLKGRLARPGSHADNQYEAFLDDVARVVLIHKIKKAVNEALPRDSTVLVVSRGDAGLLELDGRQGRHFPQSEDGVYAGHYPADSAEAIAHLEELRAAGGDFLLFPATAMWWLEHYSEFKQYLERHFRVLQHQQDSCLILDLRRPMPVDAGAVADEATIAAAWAAVRTALTDAESVDLSWVQPPPREDGWTMAPDSLRFLASLVSRLKPQHILEFGSGLSTRVLARACAGLQPACCITSVDHDPEYGRKTERDLAADDTSDDVGVRIAPLVGRSWGGKLLPVYHLGRWELVSQTPPDLILIDGPPALMGGREGVLYQAMEYARPGTIILVDDAKREGELAALANWQANLGRGIEASLLPGFVKGLAVVIVRNPASMAPQ
jgi:predicted O-methyltransferase YrrM/trans-aconitate methyltransferase